MGGEGNCIPEPMVFGEFYPNPVDSGNGNYIMSSLVD